MESFQILNMIKIFYFYLENIFKYPKSDFDRLVAKFIPLLDCFSTTVIQFGSYDERFQARNNVHIQFPDRLKKTTLILDSTFLPIERRRDEPFDGDEGVWDGAHQLYGMSFVDKQIIIKLHF